MIDVKMTSAQRHIGASETEPATDGRPQPKAEAIPPSGPLDLAWRLAREAYGSNEPHFRAMFDEMLSREMLMARTSGRLEGIEMAAKIVKEYK
jgi:hypothetical protein